VLSKVIEWVQVEVGAELAEARRASAGVRAAITAAGGWSDSRLASAMEELTHLEDSLADVAGVLAITDQTEDPD